MSRIEYMVEPTESNYLNDEPMFWAYLEKAGAVKKIEGTSQMFVKLTESRLNKVKELFKATKGECNYTEKRRITGNIEKLEDMLSHCMDGWLRTIIRV